MLLVVIKVIINLDLCPDKIGFSSFIRTFNEDRLGCVPKILLWIKVNITYATKINWLYQIMCNIGCTPKRSFYKKMWS